MSMVVSLSNDDYFFFATPVLPIRSYLLAGFGGMDCYIGTDIGRHALVISYIL